MTLWAWIIAIAAFLSVIAAGVFVMLVIGIRKGDRARHLSDAPGTTLEALTRSFLGVGIRRGGHEEN
jgi:formate-dependent nitrite reductase membrane component NrfD